MFCLSLEVGQIFGKRPSNSGLLADLPPIHPHSPRPGTGGGHFSTAQNRRTSTQSSVPSVPSSPILGHRNSSNRGYSPIRDQSLNQRMFIASFCRLDNELLRKTTNGVWTDNWNISHCNVKRYCLLFYSFLKFQNGLPLLKFAFWFRRFNYNWGYCGIGKVY